MTAARAGFVPISRDNLHQKFPGKDRDCHGYSVKGSAASVNRTNSVTKMCYSYIIFAVFLCFISSAHCSVANVDQLTRNEIQIRDQTVTGDHGQLPGNGHKIDQIEKDERRTGGGNNQQRIIQKLRKIARRPDDETVQDTSRRGAILAAPVSLKAEINFRMSDLKDFLRNLISRADPSTKDPTSRRSTRDTEAQTNSETRSGAWSSGLSQAAVVGTIVGSTVAIFLIVVLAAIFCSYKNYESLEMRHRTADVFGHQGGAPGYPHHGHNSVHPNP